MRFFITGGTGFVGRYLTGRLTETGHEVTVLTRSSKAGSLPPGASFVEGDPTNPGPWQNSVLQHDVVINLAGTSIFTLWTGKARASILNSRVLTTRNLVEALSGPGKKPVLLSASAVGYYGSRIDDEVLDESSPAGNEFLTRVSIEWEREAKKAESLGVRVVLCRFGIVLGRGGGALSKMVPAFSNMLGSPLGSGRQWFSWIHEEDIFNIMLFLASHGNLSGSVNFTAPNPVTNEEMARTLAKVLKRPIFLPAVPAFVIRTLLGEFGDVLIKGQRVIPTRLMDAGYEFRFLNLQGAVEDLLRRSS